MRIHMCLSQGWYGHQGRFCYSGGSSEDGGCVPGTLRQVRDCSSTATLFTVDIYTVFPVPLFC